MNDDALFDRAADLLRGSRYTVALTGAGISTPSGIPDYRSPKSGLWENAPDMMEVASIYGFRHQPRAFYDWFRPLVRVILAARPNPAHDALARLEAAGGLWALITQNIDLLHGRAGSRELLEVHGHLREVVCLACHHIAPAGPPLEALVADGRIPNCPRCHHVMKPNVVLFGEMLPWQTMKTAQRHARAADLMLVAGSSLEVAPAGDLPELAVDNGARLILINYTETWLDSRADVIIRADVAEALPRLVEAILPGSVAIEPAPGTLSLGGTGKNPPAGDVRLSR